MLRPYQTAAIESALQALTIHGSAVMQMPTGAGKTKAATEIIKRHDKPVWFICHRQEIERQAAKAFAAAGIDFGVVSPRGKPEYDKPVQIVSVATLTRRIKDLPLPSLAIWDECHHVAAKSWAAIREQLNGAQNLGLTATPERLDGKGLSEWFGELVVGPSTRELIDSGYLSDFRYFAPSDPDLASAKMQAGDYKKGDLDKVMNTPVLIGDAIAEYQKNASGKRALVFCASVDASKALVERFNAEGIPAAHVDGTTPTDERDASVDALASGAIKVLSNVEVFTEGFDLPAIDVVILLRPTKSLALFLQMIGRALRTAEGKREALIFDHAGLWLDHDWFDLPIEWSLDGGARQRRLAGRKHGPRRCPECKEVRVEREPACDCGYEFPTGREIGEYDGQLRELRGVVPEGCVTATEYAKEIGVTVGALRAWSLRGFPYKRGVIPRCDADAWVCSNVNMETVKQRQRQLSEAPPGYEKQREFASRMGLTPSTINRWVHNGLPVDEVGFVETVAAEEWIGKNIDRKTSKIRSMRSRKEDGYLTLMEFARRHGRTSAQSWVLCGLPITDLGVPIEAGDSWLREFLSTNRRAAKSAAINDGSIRKIDFSRRHGVSLETLRRFELRGCPFLPNGRLHPEHVIAWASRQEKIDSQIPPFWVNNPHEYEQRKSFAKRIGASQKAIQSWCDKGLPCLSNGWVHIPSAIRWAAEHKHPNAKYTIPPEAWPADNDNQVSQLTAAQAA